MTLRPQNPNAPYSEIPRYTSTSTEHPYNIEVDENTAMFARVVGDNYSEDHQGSFHNADPVRTAIVVGLFNLSTEDAAFMRVEIVAPNSVNNGVGIGRGKMLIIMV